MNRSLFSRFSGFPARSRRATWLLAAATMLAATGGTALAQTFPPGDCSEGWVRTFGELNGPVRAMAFQPPAAGGGPEGSIIIGGDFTSVTVPGWVFPALGVARVDLAVLSNPQQLGSGVTGGRVSAVAVLPGGDIVVGGAFTAAGGTPVGRIARYISATGAWSTMAGGVNGSVLGLLTLPDGNLLVSGNFSTVGPGIASRGIALYRPATNTWESLGGGLGGNNPFASGMALTANGDALVVGTFTSVGGVPASNAARYRPSTGAWSAIGGAPSVGFGAVVELPDGQVLLGGYGSAYGLARYDPTTQSWTGPLITNPTYALARLPDGSSLVGSQGLLEGDSEPPLGFGLDRYRADPAPSGSVVPFGGRVNGGPNQHVMSIATVPDGSVWVGGWNERAVRSGLLARYVPPTTAPAVTTQPAAMLTIVGGTAVFDIAGTTPGSMEYRWRKDGVALDIVANPTAAKSVLRLANLQPSDAGLYDCVLTGTCSGLSVTSTAAALTFPGPACPADFNGDAFVDFFDFQDFVDAFEEGC
jgi:hypothetical protein